MFNKLAMPSTKRKFGDTGEVVATEFLARNGYRIVAKNYSKRYGEIDVIGRKGGVITFFEVKTSRYFPESSFSPEIRVDGGKMKRLIKTCETYLAEKKLPEDQEWKIDVISVILNEDSSVREINHIENAVFGRRY